MNLTAFHTPYTPNWLWHLTCNEEETRFESVIRLCRCYPVNLTDTSWYGRPESRDDALGKEVSSLAIPSRTNVS